MIGDWSSLLTLLDCPPIAHCPAISPDSLVLLMRYKRGLKGTPLLNPTDIPFLTSTVKRFFALGVGALTLSLSSKLRCLSTISREATAELIKKNVLPALQYSTTLFKLQISWLSMDAWTTLVLKSSPLLQHYLYIYLIGSPRLTRQGNPTEDPRFLNAHTASTRAEDNDNTGFKGDSSLTMFELIALSGISYNSVSFFIYFFI